MPKYHFFIDFNSNDNTLKLIKKYRDENLNIKIVVINQKSRGIYKAWNIGLLKLLEIENLDHYVCMLNSDDWFVDEYIKIISQYEGFDLIAGSSIVHYANKSFERPCRSFKMLPFFMPIIDPSLCIKLSVFGKIGLYRESFLVAADHDFVYRAYEMGCSFKILKEVLVNIKMGGFAIQNKKIASIEQLKLAKERCLLPLPDLAFLYRMLKIPRFRLFDFF